MTAILNFFIDHSILFFFLILCIIPLREIFRRQKSQKFAIKTLKKAKDNHLAEPLSLHPEVNAQLCVGCGTCTRVCPEGDILKLIHHKSVLVGPTKCVGHGECERSCPMGAIQLVFGSKTKGVEIPRLTANYETNLEGLYIAGEMGGMGLIRNAIKQGTLSATHAIKHLTRQKADYDLLIIGAGPAGIAASLTAHSLKKNYLCIEQHSFGGTISNFPRQKIVMSHPLDLPVYGRIQFSSNRVSKENLLQLWNEIRKKMQLNIQEKNRFLSLKKEGSIFKIETSSGTLTAQKIILAMGVRGTPRKLNVPGEDLAKVTYNLIDPEQYQNQKIIVVGGGNAGVEAAQMLASKKYSNTLHLLVRSQNFDRCNEENINKIRKLEKEGLVHIWFQSSVEKIELNKVIVKNETGKVTLENDYLFIFAGAEIPHKFLMSLGVQIDKKFGEAICA